METVGLFRKITVPMQQNEQVSDSEETKLCKLHQEVKKQGRAKRTKRIHVQKRYPVQTRYTCTDTISSANYKNITTKPTRTTPNRRGIKVTNKLNLHIAYSHTQDQHGNRKYSKNHSSLKLWIEYLTTQHQIFSFLRTQQVKHQI